MRSRIAITALLASGALMSSGGAALGVSALSTTTDASQAQYGPVQPAERIGPSGETLPEQPVSPGSDTLAGAGGVKPATAEGDSKPQIAEAQPARQLEQDGREQLPFTGYASIPLLLIGLTLLVAGLVLRRGARSPQLT